MSKNRKKYGVEIALAVVAGLVGGTLGALLSTSYSALSTSTTSVASAPVALEPGTPVLLFDQGEAHATVKVDRNGVVILNFTTRTGQNRIALGVLGDSKLELGVFDSAGKARAGMEIPMRDSGRVQTLLLDKQAGQLALKTRTKS
jgi:hypothetical protein